MAGKTCHTLPLTLNGLLLVRNLHILGNMPWSRVIQARDSTPPGGILSATLQATLHPDQVQQLYSPCFLLFFLLFISLLRGCSSLTDTLLGMVWVARTTIYHGKLTSWWFGYGTVNVWKILSSRSLFHIQLRLKSMLIKKKK